MKNPLLLRTISLGLLITIAYQVSFAQNEDLALSEDKTNFLSKISISGSIDAYFRANLNNTNKEGVNPDLQPTLAPFTSFANLPGFALGMANLVLGYEDEKTGFVADLVFGPRGEEAVFTSEGSSNIVNQLYMYWNVSKALTLTFGNFNTFLGYEVISPTANFNYSTSYLFSYGPFSHTGVKADFSIADGWNLMMGFLNPTDLTEFNPSAAYFGGLQLGYDFGVGRVYLNGLVGNGYAQIDVTASADLTHELYLGLNATIADADAGFSGIAAYLQYALSDAFSLGTRFEYFTDDGVSAFAPEGQPEAKVFDVTISANYNVGSLTLIPELRLDSFNEDVVIDTDGNNQGGLVSFVLAAIYSF